MDDSTLRRPNIPGMRAAVASDSRLVTAGVLQSNRGSEMQVTARGRGLGRAQSRMRAKQTPPIPGDLQTLRRPNIQATSNSVDAKCSDADKRILPQPTTSVQLVGFPKINFQYTPHTFGFDTDDSLNTFSPNKGAVSKTKHSEGISSKTVETSECVSQNGLGLVLNSNKYFSETAVTSSHVGPTMSINKERITRIREMMRSKAAQKMLESSASVANSGSPSKGIAISSDRGGGCLLNYENRGRLTNSDKETFEIEKISANGNQNTKYSSSAAQSREIHTDHSSISVTPKRPPVNEKMVETKERRTRLMTNGNKNPLKNAILTHLNLRPENVNNGVKKEYRKMTEESWDPEKNLNDVVVDESSVEKEGGHNNYSDHATAVSQPLALSQWEESPEEDYEPMYIGGGSAPGGRQSRMTRRVNRVRKDRLLGSPVRITRLASPGEDTVARDLGYIDNSPINIQPQLPALLRRRLMRSGNHS